MALALLIHLPPDSLEERLVRIVLFLRLPAIRIGNPAPVTLVPISSASAPAMPAGYVLLVSGLGLWTLVVVLFPWSYFVVFCRYGARASALWPLAHFAEKGSSSLTVSCPGILLQGILQSHALLPEIQRTQRSRGHAQSTLPLVVLRVPHGSSPLSFWLSKSCDFPFPTCSTGLTDPMSPYS